jgi:L-fuconolactonase
MEVVMRGADLERLAHLAAEMPGLRIMLNHLAFVKVTGEPPDAAWVTAMERFSGLPNVFCKVSRFTEQAAIQPAPLDAAYYAPVFDVVWAVFGPDRLAYGSNWPPCLNVGDYRGTVDLARDYFRAKGADALAKVMGRNAAAFYGGPGFPALHALGDA